MKIIGISNAHDSGACILENGKILSSVNEERLTKVKSKGGPPLHSIREVMRISGTRPEEIDVVAYSDLRPRDFAAKTYPLIAKKTLQGLPRFPGFRTTRLKKRYVATIRGFLKGMGVEAEERFVEHHTCHAASAFYTSGFEECLAVTADGEGDSVSSTVNLCRDNRIRRVITNDVYKSFGLFYAQVTKALGFRVNRHEGKIVGLAAYGDHEKLYDKVSPLISVNRKNFRIEGDIQKWYMKYSWERVARELGVLARNNKREDVAAAFQKRLEDVLSEYVDLSARRFGVRKVCLAGGVFANVKLNQRIHELDCVDEVFVHPGMSDAGLHLGAALKVSSDLENEGVWNGRTLQRLGDVYLGPGFSDREIESEIKSMGLEYERFRNIERETASLVSEDRVVARFNGRMEYGPRALGNRSILAMPTDPSINTWLNKRLKRTEFMPFAPSILEESAGKFYRGIGGAEHTAEFMTITFDTTKHGSRNSPAVVHVDDTARPQFVPKGVNPSYRKIIEGVEDLTGLPLILNTSFNMHEAPIVCTPRDAIESFLQGSLDALSIGSFMIKGRGLA
jgi:carbamoyltransferase